LNRKEKNTKTAFIILSVIIASSAIALADNPSIGKNTGQIVFDDKTGSPETFKVWNKGTGTLNYKVSVSVGAKYFKVTPTTGQSRDMGETRTHTVSVDFNTIPHGTTTTGQIKITNNSDVTSPQYIELSVNDTISRHIQFIKIEQGIDYIPGAGDKNAATGNCDGLGLAGDFDCDGYVDFFELGVLAEQWLQTGSDIRADIFPDYKNGSVDFEDFAVFSNNWNKDGRIGETYDFSLIVETDNSVADLNFITPDGFTYPDSSLKALRHIETTRTRKNGITYWRHQEWFYEANGLDNYPDGKYTVKVIYADHNSDQTIVNFGVPKQAGSIARPTQRPKITYPLNTEGAVSPLQFTWAKCTDSNVDSIRLDFNDHHDSNLAEQQYDKTAVKANALKLEPRKWFAELSFGRWYQVQNDNDISIEVGKASRIHSSFNINTGFGTFGGLNNHQLQVADCQGKMVTFSLTGGGSGTVEGDPNIQNDCSFARIILSGTTDKSVLTITPQKGAKTTIGSIESDGPIKTINAPGVNVTGNINIKGMVAGITLNDIPGDSNIKIGSTVSLKASCSVKLGRTNKLTLTSGTPIASLKATEWKSGSLNAPWISNLTIAGNSASAIAGDFGADLKLSGQGSPKGTSLKNAKIAGEIGDSTWSIIGNCGTVTAASASAGLDVNITGTIGTLQTTGNKKLAVSSVLSGKWHVVSVNTIKATDISECNFIAGLTTTGKTTAIGNITAGRLIDSDLTAANGLLKTLNIKGVKEEPFGVINSDINAKYIGTAYLAYPKYSNGGTLFGLKAGTIDKVTVKDPAKTTSWKGSQIGAEGLTTEDFQIKLQ
jgi:hypothetical protein